MAASADVFLAAASDSITRQLLDDHPTGLDVTVTAAGSLAPEAVANLDAALRDQIERVGRLDEPVRSSYADLSLQSPPADEVSEAQPIIGSGARFVARGGAIDALDVVDGDRSVDGLWLSAAMSDRLALPAGSMVAINDREPIPVAGVFANLWEGERDPYWDDVPAPLVPRFSSVFGRPTFETIILTESLLLDLGVDGLVRWDSPMIDRPETYPDLVAQSQNIRRLESASTRSVAVVSALDAFAGPGGPVPVVATDVEDLRFDIETIIGDLDQPIATASIGGILLGLIVTAAGAAFAVRKLETETRLLRSDGDAAWRFAGRALAQFAAPAAVGAAIGVGAALIAVAPPGESVRGDSRSIDLGTIATTALLGLVVAVTITAVSASRVLDVRRSTIGSLRLAWFLPVVGVAAAAWVQVGSAGEPGEVDALVIGFPLIGLIAGVGVVVLAVRWLMRRVHRTGSRLPPALFLAWRRITSSDSSATLLSVAMGIALGLIVFSTSLVGGLDTATEAKATTVVGGVTQARVVGTYRAPLPEATTMIRSQTTRLTIGGDPVNVLAIDPATYAAGVSWHPTFGSSAAELVEALGTTVDTDVAAVAVAGFPVPDVAGFGTSTVFSYSVVATVEAAPLTPTVFPTLVVSAEQVDAAARRDHEALRPAEVDRDEWAAEFRSPLLRSRTLLVSQLDDVALTAFLDSNDVDVDELTTLSGREQLVANRAARWTFEYLGVLAVIAGLAAVGTLLFYLSEQRANRRLSTVMAERMGLRWRVAAVSAVGEVLGLVTVAFVAGTSTGLVLAAHIFNRFEPDPRLVPDVGLEPRWLLVGAVGTFATITVVVAALLNQWAGARRSYAEVLRES